MPPMVGPSGRAPTEQGGGPVIHRKQIEPGEIFKAGLDATLGWQQERKAFSVWHSVNDFLIPGRNEHLYTVLPTGMPFPPGYRGTCCGSVVLPDGFTVFHLIYLQEKKDDPIPSGAP